MTPDDIPDHLVDLAQHAHNAAPQKRDGKPTRMRYALAAVWPEIAKHEREQVAAELREDADAHRRVVERKPSKYDEARLARARTLDAAASRITRWTTTRGDADPCGARPRFGSTRCDRPAGHDGKHSAPLAIGGRIVFTDAGTMTDKNLDGYTYRRTAADAPDECTGCGRDDGPMYLDTRPRHPSDPQAVYCRDCAADLFDLDDEEAPDA